MQQNHLFRDCTLQTLPDRLDVIECFQHPGKRIKVGEILQKQNKLYSALGVNSPSS
ncbi:MAG: hypothetical protein LBR29_02250 [Methylobacteriaceae bacterium]|nr:hypothetical protein [Methylobacteriaceae bacterium]